MKKVVVSEAVELLATSVVGAAFAKSSSDDLNPLRPSRLRASFFSPPLSEMYTASEKLSTANITDIMQTVISIRIEAPRRKERKA